ncbi:MAG: LLM class F420-dependent oxidoreductase [Deltaproteobacteria bacterium]|nr:LLM class F420-dependent oxidoreductase [Acidobacteriota bacterium]MBV8770754.1 LLM class F420-dependent oxidoreductase [Deltaproteobacteria bacterium]
MKIGFFAIGIGNLAQPELITAVATNAERLNFATVWAPEHVVFLERFTSRYPYSRGQNLPITTEIPLLNPFIALTYAAAHTTRIRLATGICLVPEYNPLLLAKICATLDHLSGGRLALGIGIGWLREEFDALGIPWERRAQRTKEYIEAMRCVWGDGRSYSAEFVNFDGALSYPKPVKGARLPILVGGQTEAALKRAAAYGDGWCGFNLTPDETAQTIKRLRSLLAANGRASDSFEFLVSPTADATPADLGRYRDAGVEELYLTPVFQRPVASEADIKKLTEELSRSWVEPALKL